VALRLHAPSMDGVSRVGRGPGSSVPGAWGPDELAVERVDALEKDVPIVRSGKNNPMAKLTENLPSKDRTRRQHVGAAIDTMMRKLLYDDRKEDDDLPGRAIEKALLAGDVTIDEILMVVLETLETAVEGYHKERAEAYVCDSLGCACRCGPCSSWGGVHCLRSEKRDG
jgi:hypothetical protein